MIVVDLETSGLTGRSGIWQIGALEFENTNNYFLQEARIDDEDIIEAEALKITGKTEAELRNPSKQPQKQLILNYLDWVESVKEKIFWGENVGWDVSMIQDKCIKYGIRDLFRKVHGHRTMDIHTLAQDRYRLINEVYLIDEKGKDALGLSKNLEFCGLPDDRIKVKDGQVSKKGKPHNALEDCKLEAECISRLRDGKNLLPEYAKFKIPQYLLK